MSRRRSDLPILHLLNAVFAPLTGSDLYLANQIKAGIDSALGKHDKLPGTATIASAIEQLCQVFGVPRDDGFLHLDARDTAGSLFARQQVVEGMKQLAPFQNATLLVTNLRDSLCPAGRRWTKRRRADYDETVKFISNLAAARKRQTTNLTVLFI